jgi:hypothetical protein
MACYCSQTQTRLANRLIGTRGTTKDNDDATEKGIDQPQKRDDGSNLAISNSNFPLANLTAAHDNSTFEGAIAYWIETGLKTNYMDANLTQNGLADFPLKGSILPDR